jgi:cyanate permease
MDAPSVEQATTQEDFNSRYRFVIAGLLVTSYLALGLNFYSPSPVLPLIMEDYDISNAVGSMVVTLGLLAFAFFGIPGGVIVSRMGLRTAVTAGSALMALMVLTTLAPNVWVMLVLRGAYGLGIALMFTASGPMLMRWFSPKEVAIMNGVNTGAVAVGIAVSLLAAARLSDVVGWASALSILSVLGIVATAGWMVFGSRAGAASPAVPVISRRVLKEVLTNKTVLLVVAANAGLMIQYTTLSTWLPTFYNEVRGMSLEGAGEILWLVPFVGIFSVLLGGFLPGRFGSKRMYFIVPGVLILLAGPGSYLLTNLGAIYLAVIALGFFSWLCIPSFLSLPMEMRGATPEKVALIWGYLVTVEGFTTFAMPLAVGALRDVTGSLHPGFVICTVLALAVLAAGVLIPKEDLVVEAAPQPEAAPALD